MKPSSDSATQITDSVPEASDPPLAEAVKVGVGVTPERQRIIAAEDQRFFADHRRLKPAQAGLRPHVVEADAGVFGFEVDRGFKADALIGGEVIGRRHGLHAGAVAAGNAEPQSVGVDAGDGAPIGLNAAAAGDARRLVAERREHGREELGAGFEIVKGEAVGRAGRLRKSALFEPEGEQARIALRQALRFANGRENFMRGVLDGHLWSPDVRWTRRPRRGCFFLLPPAGEGPSGGYTLSLIVPRSCRFI